MQQATVELTAELLVDGRGPLHPAISPDGRRVAYVVTTLGFEERPVSTLWVAATDGSAPPRALTDGTAWDCFPRWAPDSASLFFRSNRQLHRIPVDGGEIESLAGWPGGLLDHWPLADGLLVAVTAVDQPEGEDEGCDAVVWGEDAPCGRLRLLDLGTGEYRTVEELGNRHVLEVVQRPDGGPLAVLSWATPDEDPGAFTAELHLVDPGTGKVGALGPVGLEARSPVWWQLDGAWHLAYLGRTDPLGTAGGNAVFGLAVPEAGPAGQPRNLTEGMAVCPTDLAQVADGTPLALFADGLDTALYRLDPEEQRFHRLSTEQGRANALRVSRSGELIALTMSTAQQPKGVYAGPPGGQLLRLTETRPEIREVRLGARERLSYKADDGLELDGLLILPVGRSREEGPFPLITMVHGGPYDRYADEFLPGPLIPAQWFATTGHAVFLPNPRGGEGHGHEFAAAVAGRAGQEEWTDILTGIDLLITEGVADPERLGIAGWSHGGFMAAWAVGQTDRFKAALMGAGISDWGMLAATGEQGAVLESNLTGSVGWEGPGPHPHDRLSPVSYASRVRTPVLIVHGEEDTNVPVSQSVYFHRALRRYGVEHQFVVYPREGHGIMERAHQLDLLRRSRAWFDRRLGKSSPQDGNLAAADGH